MDRAEWLEIRRSGVGSSDAPNLVGVGFRTAADVYREKVSPPDPRLPVRGVLRRGIDLEPVAAALYAEVMGVELAAADLERHPVRPWQLASPDRVRPDGRRVELKTTAGFGGQWGEPGTDEVPDGYRVQVQHQMGVKMADSIDLAALDVIAWELRVYRIDFDPEFFAWLTDVEARFVREHVEPRVPPAPDWERQFHPGYLARVVNPDTSVELGPDVSRLVEQRAALSAVRDEADEEYKRVDARIRALMGGAEVALCPGWRVRQVVIADKVIPEHVEPEKVRKGYSYLRATRTKERT